MIFALIIWILKSINPSIEDIESMFPKVVNVEILQTFIDLGNFSKFDSLGRGAKLVFWLVLGFELATEFILFLKWLPRYLSAKFERMRNKPKNEVEILKAIKYKLDNDIYLSSKEQRFWRKKVKKQGKNSIKKKGGDINDY